MKEDNKYYDAILNVTLTNLFTLSKQTKKLVLKNYKEKNPSHRCVLEVASLLSLMGMAQIEIITSPLNFLFLKIFGHNKFFRGKWIKRSKSKEGVDINEIISHIEEANNDPGVFSRIYSCYFVR